MDETTTRFQGFFDGYRGGAFEGWVWQPDEPDAPVVVEVYANGFRLGETEASIYRPDLRAAGIGHGRFGFSLAFPIDLERTDAVQVSVRIKDGPTLAGGETTLGGAEPLSDEDATAFQAFIAAVLGRGAPREVDAGEPDPKTHFIVYCPTGAEAKSGILGMAEYSYAFVLKAFAPLLARFGEVHLVDDPARQVDLLYAAHLARGETSLFLSFAPPHRTTLGLRCPVIPVIAWEFPTIPSEVWDEERRHDWRWVLRQTGRAITLSDLAARAVKAAMGVDFPVVAIPAPVWDRQPEGQRLPARAPATPAVIEVDGFVFDSRKVGFSAGMSTPRLPAPGELPGRVELSGVVFTSVFSPKDGRKNWPDLVTAFLAALADRSDATLVLKMVGNDPEQWWWELFDRVSRMPEFACRLVVINGFLDDARYNQLIAASQWVVNASSAEGLCLPLIEFMCAGRPAIAPAHTAMADYLDASCGLVVHADEQYCGWPHDTRMGMTTTRHPVSWSALKAAYEEGYRLVREAPARYDALGQAAANRMEAFCSDAIVAERLSAFLGLGHLTTPPPQASELLMADMLP
jgi:glycosyltransferase involved in cell wall biosynthesis